MQDKYEEVVIVIIAGSVIFLVLTGIMVFITLFYQKKKFEHYRQLADLKLEIQEQTFNVISQEIHDNVGQILSLAKVQLNILEQVEPLNRQLIIDTKESVSKAINDLRDIAKGLSTQRIHQLSLPEIAESELERINRIGLMHTCMQVEGSLRNVNEQKKLVIFRIIQEALQNILKHSNAKNINLNFYYHPDNLKLSISDDGIGFNSKQLSKINGLGLQNITTRAALIGGKAEIASTINHGTIITITSPYA